MTNGRGAGMASFMTKKKKYKFQVDLTLEELLEVPFVSAVLFAKLRLLDGGNFQDHSRREEVRDHTVKWGVHYSFPCKMLANASTGVLERCVLRISVRKECKGGRSFTKLGFVDLNLAEFAGAGVTCKKALLEGYDTRHRQDNSMLRISIKMNMLSGDILFKVPSPSLKHKPVVPTEEAVVVEPRVLEEFSGGSLAGSIASGSSGFGSLPKKRPPLLSSELVIGHTLAEGNVPVTVAPDGYDYFTTAALEPEEASCEPGHSRNSSNTSQMSKASGYSSIHSHSRQSSSGDSGHIREQPHKRGTTINIPSSFPEDARTTPLNNRAEPPTPDDTFATPRGSFTPGRPELFSPSSRASCGSEEFRTPDATMHELRGDAKGDDYWQQRVSDGSKFGRLDSSGGVLRSKSDFEIPRNGPTMRAVDAGFFHSFAQKSDSLFAFLTPLTKRRAQNLLGRHSTPTNRATVASGAPFNYSPIQTYPVRNSSVRRSVRTTSLNSLRSAAVVQEDGPNAGAQPAMPRNPSSSSLVLSETGSLDRAKAALERRKKNQPPEPDAVVATGRVEGTRVNPDHLIDEIIKNTNLEEADASAESSGLQLFIAKDGTAALGSHEVKSQMSTGVFKQVVMEDNR